MGSWILRALAIGALALPLCGCLSDQKQAMAGCRGQTVQACMAARGYVTDYKNHYCGVMADPKSDEHCYRPEGWFASLATDVEMIGSSPPPAPGAPTN